jgi:hypothetical protein
MLLSEDRRKGALLEQIGRLLASHPDSRPSAGFRSESIASRVAANRTLTNSRSSFTQRNQVMMYSRLSVDDDTVQVLSREGLGIEKGLSLMVDEARRDADRKETVEWIQCEGSELRRPR